MTYKNCEYSCPIEYYIKKQLALQLMPTISPNECSLSLWREVVFTNCKCRCSKCNVGNGVLDAVFSCFGHHNYTSGYRLTKCCRDHNDRLQRCIYLSYQPTILKYERPYTQNHVDNANLFVPICKQCHSHHIHTDACMQIYIHTYIKYIYAHSLPRLEYGTT